jgi:hypothetical protein
MAVIRAAVALGRKPGAGGRGEARLRARRWRRSAADVQGRVGSGGEDEVDFFLFSFRHILDFFNTLHVGPRPSQQNDLCFCHLSTDKWVPHVKTAVNWL